MINRQNMPGPFSPEWEKFPVWTEVSEDVYDYFLTDVKTANDAGTYFQYGEAYDWREKYTGHFENRYLTFGKYNEKYWFMGIQFTGVMNVLF